MEKNIIMYIVGAIVILIIVSTCRKLFSRMNKILKEVRRNNEYQEYFFSNTLKRDEPIVSSCIMEIQRTKPEGTFDYIAIHPAIKFAIHYRVGDIFVLNRKDINKSTLCRSLDRLASGNVENILQDEYTFGKNGNKCYIQIVERVFRDGYLDLQAKIIPEVIEVSGVNNKK
ncbi:MAG: hypothetical protein PEPC_01707 [Peptostreptococcus russellii]